MSALNECLYCGCYDEDYGCTCSPLDKWYACPIESEKPENIQALKEYAEWSYRKVGLKERDLVRSGDLVGYYDDDGDFVVVADCSLTDADMDRYAVQVQNGEGYYNAEGRYVRFIDYDYHSEDEYY